MKFRVLAIVLIAANFAFSHLAQAQYMNQGMMNPGMMGTGAVGGGMTTCAYPNGPASGASSQDDELSDLQRQQSDLTKDVREFSRDIRTLERDLRRARATIDERFKPIWASVIIEHMDKGMNCSLCGPSTYPAPPPAPPVYPTNPPIQEPPPPPPPPPPVVVQEPPVVVQPPPPVSRPRPPTQTRPDPGSVVPLCSTCVARYPRDSAGRARCLSSCQAADNRDVFPIQTGGSRMPASEVGGSGSITVAPVPAGGAVESPNPWANEPTSYNVNTGGSSETGGPQGCYDRTVEPYARPSWVPPQGICRPDGNISAQACRIPGYLNSSDRSKESECSSALSEYRDLARELQEKRADLALAQEELRRVKSDIRILKRENARDARDNDGMEAGRSGGRNITVVQQRPSFLSSLAPVLAGALVGGGLEYMNYRNANRNNDRLNELGWPTLPYQSNGYGLMVGAGVYGAVAGAQNGAFGCGQMMGNNGMGAFGNPYMQGGMMGGGMFNGGYGYPGMMGGGYPGMGGGNYVGGMIGGVVGGGGYPGMMGMQGGGYPGMMGGYGGMYAGQAGGGFPGGGYPGMMGMQGGGFPGMQGGNYVGGVIGGVVGGGGYPGMMGGYPGMQGGGYPGMTGGYGGMYAGQAGGGFPGGSYAGGYAGMASYAGMSSYAGYAGGGLGLEYQQQMAQMQMEYQQRAAANELAKVQQQQGLMGQYYELMYKFNQLQSGGGISSSYSYPSYGSSYPTIGVGTGSTGVSGTTILPTTPTTVPSRSR